MVRRNTPANRRIGFKLLYDFFHKPYLWPNQIRRIVYENTNINNRERFILYVFLLNNGFSPDHAQQLFETLWILDRDSQSQINYLRAEWNRGWKYKSWECIAQDQGKYRPSKKYCSSEWARQNYFHTDTGSSDSENDAIKAEYDIIKK